MSTPNLIDALAQSSPKIHRADLRSVDPTNLHHKQDNVAQLQKGTDDKSSNRVQPKLLGKNHTTRMRVVIQKERLPGLPRLPFVRRS